MSRLRYTTFDPTLLQRAVRACETATDTTSPEHGWMPVNARQSEDTLYLTVAMPGLPAEAIDITIDEGVLTIGGTVPAAPGPEAASGETSGSWLLREHQITSYQRKLRLPWAVDEQRITAISRDGLLYLTLPKAAHLKPQRITVQSGEAVAV